MADPRLANHQQFDALRCRLCNRIYDKPKLLGCLHSFCLSCLEEYVTENSSISSNQLQCPMCKEVTDLSVGGVSSLTDNTLIKRYISQAHRDKTQIVAGREVLELQRQALTEADLQCPDIVSSIQQIANTAGQVIASGIEEQSQLHDFDTVKIRHDLQAKTVHLQEKALDIVSSIDQVNQEVTEWNDNRNRMHEQVKMRSAEIQNIVQSIERKLITCIDDKDMENQLKDMSFSVKSKLHKTLKCNLTTVDFMKLLTEFGDGDDLSTFVPIVDAKVKKILNESVQIKTESYMFDQPSVDIREGLEMIFGGLSKCSEEKLAWDPQKPSQQQWYQQHQQPKTNDSSPSSDVESHSGDPKHHIHTDPHLPTNYVEIDENGHNPNASHDYGSKLSKRFEHNVEKTRRRPMKSMSFDAGVMSANQHMPLLGNEHTELSLNYDIETSNASNNFHGNGSNSSDNKVISAIQSLNPNPGHRSWIRRVSAPSSTIINTLNRRRLSALSILERANIDTEGLNKASDVESGLTEARLEWLRENFHRRMENVGRQSSVEEEEV